MISSPILPPTDVIRAAGLRATRQRTAVLEAVDTAPHASAAAVLGAVSAVLPGVSHQAVYDCLADLTEAGLLRRITVDGGPALYETRTRDQPPPLRLPRLWAGRRCRLRHGRGTVPGCRRCRGVHHRRGRSHLPRGVRAVRRDARRGRPVIHHVRPAQRGEFKWLK